MINSTTETGSRIIAVLEVPSDTPDLMPEKRRELQDGETYIVKAWDRLSPELRLSVPVLVDNPVGAFRIARKRAGAELGIDGHQIEGVPKLVTFDEFISECKNVILEGRDLPFHIMRLRDLQEFAAELEPQTLRQPTFLSKAS